MVDYMQNGPGLARGHPREASRPAGRRASGDDPVRAEREGAAARPPAPRSRPAPCEEDRRVDEGDRPMTHPAVERGRVADGAALQPRALGVVLLRGLVALADPGGGLRVLWRRSTTCATRTPTGSLVVLVAVGVGVGGVFVLYWAMNRRRGPPARAVPGGRPTVGVRRARPGDPGRVPGLSADQHDPDQLQGRRGRELRRARQLQVRVHRREHAPGDPQHAGLDLCSCPCSP